MNFIDVLIIIAVLFISAFLIELLMIKLFNITIRKERYINEQHKKRYKQFIIVFSVIMLVLLMFYLLGFIIIFIPITFIILYPIASALVDLIMEWKYAREDRRYIVSISNIMVYITFLIVLFITDFFGMV
ncbi:DUF4181 domain-containing protein [Aquisalibacillus elongatus]|uniref:Uncharacterized protein DUF4181 n=1 Tax=Aquisalibacillus elongatus TaxID=485577 RepID=A0A3N5B7P1_9BACI|nr:DUF4181 domain-containing protein [Aquisalibacillus elongatus]RPF53353.1 uncharacterized protein DUF4181 [Aquisalibacillus elongatus]